MDDRPPPPADLLPIQAPRMLEGWLSLAAAVAQGRRSALEARAILWATYQQIRAGGTP